MALLSPPSAAGVAIQPQAMAQQPTESPVRTAAWIKQQQAKQEQMERVVAEETARDMRTRELKEVIEQLRARVGKTPYVLTGSTPSGWDCSGMVYWAYLQMGIELEHRASKQKTFGEIVTEPKLGDIVAFTYGGASSAFHTGIWLAPDLMIHAGGRKGDRTEIIPISSFESGSTVTYTRIIDTN